MSDAFDVIEMNRKKNEPPFIGEIIHVRNPNLSIDKCRPAIVTAEPTADGKIPATTFTSYAVPSVGYIIFWHKISDCVGEK